MPSFSEILEFAKRRGFVYPSAEIYGGEAGFYDYGSYGAALKRRWENIWLEYFLSLGDNYHFIDPVNILPTAALKSSGHLDHFTDVIVECTKCHTSYRADQLVEDKTGKSVEGLSPDEMDNAISTLGLKCERCNSPLSKASHFNMMFPLTLGPKGEEKSFLRPETAQCVYLNFNREWEILRRKLPLGIAIVGKAYRNEIAPRQVLFRMRELIQAELQIFFDPEKFEDELDISGLENRELNVLFASDRGNEKFRELKFSDVADRLPIFFVYHMLKAQEFYDNVMRVPMDRFRFYEKSEKERAFYTRLHFDIELEQESLGGFKEVAGIHYRGDYDLSCHQKGSGVDFSINVGGRKFIPHVLELSFGVDRNVWALLDIHFSKQKDKNVLCIPPRLAPVELGIFPLVSKDGLDKKATEIYKTLKKEGFQTAFYDESGSIGRRYARMDEVGTPFCVTIDYETIEKNDVTVRERDTGSQVRVKVEELAGYLRKRIMV